MPQEALNGGDTAWILASAALVLLMTPGVALFYGGAVALWALAFWLLREDWLALLALIPAGIHLGWQVTTLDPADPANPLERFRANRWTGMLVAAACFVVGSA